MFCLLQLNAKTKTEKSCFFSLLFWWVFSESEHSWAYSICHSTDHNLRNFILVITQFWNCILLLHCRIVQWDFSPTLKSQESGSFSHIPVSKNTLERDFHECLIVKLFTFTFIRRFYPKRLEHSSYSFYISSALAFPGNRTHDLGVASAMLY